MKHLLITLLLLVCWYHSAYAQFERGKMAVGINLSGGYYNNTPKGNITKSFTYSIAPNIGFEIFTRTNQSILLGYSSSLTHSKRALSDTNYIVGQTIDATHLNDEFMLGPYIGFKKYWLNTTGKFGLFIAPIIGIEWKSSKGRSLYINTNTGVKNEYEWWGKESWRGKANLPVGFTYFIKPQFSIELTSNVISYEITSNYDRIYLMSSLNNIIYGVRYYF